MHETGIFGSRKGSERGRMSTRGHCLYLSATLILRMSTVTEPWIADGQAGPSSSTSPRPPTATADPLDFSDIFSFSSLPTAPHHANHIPTADNVQQQAEIEEMMLPEDPEPPDASDMLNMREKLAAMGLVDAPSEAYATTREGDLTARERILTNMVSYHA